MKISLVISDVDATLITPEHEITARALQAVKDLRTRNIKFTIASSRPPRGLADFAKQLELTEPFASFNGAIIARPDGEVLMKHLLPREIGEIALEVAEQFAIQLWVYCEQDWYVAANTQYVEREEHTSGFAAIVEPDLRKRLDNAAKLVIVGDPPLVAQAEPIALERMGDKVSATKSKPRFLDITAAAAHKGTVVTQLSQILSIPTTEIAVIGDGANDILMFERAGFSIAMGQADDQVKKSANVVTTANTDEGFANGIEKYILG